MNCPKCATEMKIFPNNVVDVGLSVVTFFRCEQCWVSYNIVFSNPICCDGYTDPLRLESMHGDERHTYYKCSKPSVDSNTLVACVGPYVNRERLEAMGFKVSDPDSNNTLPAYRLYRMV